MDGLAETVALVSGASRGVGRGVAQELGAAGATVWLTGRSRDDGPTTEDLPETVDGTARLVDEAGGRGIPVTCDHTDDEAVAALAERIRARSGALHLFVNCVWGGYEEYDHHLYHEPLEDQPIWRWDKMFRTGVRAHYVTARAVAPLMEDSGGGLMVGISAGDEGKFLWDVQYDVAKAAVDRLGFALAAKLRDRGITALTLHADAQHVHHDPVLGDPGCEVSVQKMVEPVDERGRQQRAAQQRDVSLLAQVDQFVGSLERLGDRDAGKIVRADARQHFAALVAGLLAEVREFGLAEHLHAARVDEVREAGHGQARLLDPLVRDVPIEPRLAREQLDGQVFPAAREQLARRNRRRGLGALVVHRASLPGPITSRGPLGTGSGRRLAARFESLVVRLLHLSLDALQDVAGHVLDVVTVALAGEGADGAVNHHLELDALMRRALVRNHDVALRRAMQEAVELVEALADAVLDAVIQLAATKRPINFHASSERPPR